jgi:hypothetical protein
MLPNEFIPGFVLLAAAFCGWTLIRFLRSRSKLSENATFLLGTGILVISSCLFLFYGCGMAKEYRSALSFAPDRKHAAQITELDFGPGPFNTSVELRSRCQLFAETVFQSHGDPREIEAMWPNNTELVIRYASGHASDRDYPLLCMHEFKTVKITCEAVEGDTLHPK